MFENAVYPNTPEDVLDLQILNDEGYTQALIDQAGWYGGYGTEIEALQAKERAREARALALQNRDDFERTYAPFFTQRKRVYEENYNYWQSQQWTDTDIANLLGDGIPPYISNVMKRQADTVTGEQRSRECDWRAVGRSQEADTKAEFQNHFLRSISQANKWNRTKAYVFRDGFVGSIGVASSSLDPADPKGNIILKRHRAQEFMWHLETAENGSLENTMFVERLYWVQRSTLMWEFPMWADSIRNLEGLMYASIYPYLDTIIRPKVRRTTGSSVGYDAMTFDPWQSRFYRQMLLKREFYDRRMVPKWRVTNGYTATHYDVDSKGQAEYIYKQLCAIWSLQQSAATGQPPDTIVPRIAEPRFVQVPVIDQQIWIGDELVAVNRDEDNSIPYHFFIPEYHDGDITSPFEHGKDMQRLRNISMSVMHKKAAGFKGKWVVNQRFLPQNMTPAQIDAMMMSDIKPLYIDSADAEAVKKAFYYVPPANQDGAFIEQLIKLTSDDINYQGGGLNAVGLQESSGESGRAINARQQTGALANINVMDEFNYFDEEVGERVLYLGQFIDSNVQFRAINPDGRPEFMSMADAGIQDIEEQKFSVTIEETLSSPTEREAELNRLASVIQQVGPNSPVAVPTALQMFKKMDMDASDRAEIEGQVQSQQQFQNQLQERQMKLSEDQQRMKETDTQQRNEQKWKELELEEMKIKTPAVSIAMKPMDTPPAMLAEAMNQWKPEANADPLGVLSDQAVHQKFKQDAINLQQVSRRELMSPAEKKIEALKAAGKSPKQVASAEDTANRQNKSL